MKIQDLRDDLAEMRYFRKSYPRKMKNEMGGPMLPMPHGNGGTDADGPVGPINPIDDVIMPTINTYQQLWKLFRSITGTMM